jgi:phage gpG-like protein
MPVTAKGNDLKVMREFFSHSEWFKQQLLQSAADESVHLVKMGFRLESDPEGQPWTPLKSRRGGMPLRKTGRMANSFTAKALPNGFLVGSNVTYTIFHQEGTKGHKQYERQQAYTKRGNLDMFVRNKSGKARITTALPDDKIRTVTRANGRVIRITTKKVLTPFEIHGRKTLHFIEGGGKIPIRRMVPPSGQLTPLWINGLNRAVNSTARRIFKEARAK